ncbi:MAG TPA: CDP-alcohol phosphatidyltransferase family protein [Segeticoccus sp.]|nr:CDP-alcohol phosphatidyltransferase family protein [Segeticoccus sp.]
MTRHEDTLPRPTLPRAASALRTHRATPADLVTATRLLLACAVAALVAASFVGPPAVGILVALSAIALALDAVDGWAARRTGTVTEFGARFDGEVDAFLILVLSVYAVHVHGPWVLAIGLARYAFALAGWPLPWMRVRLPARHWRKVVAAVQGIVLTGVAAAIGPRWLLDGALLLAAALLAESFGRDVWWLWRRRPTVAPSLARPSAGGPGAGRSRRRRAVGAGADLLALVVAWCVLVFPDRLPQLSASTFLRVPLELLVVCGLALVLPVWGRRALAAVVGILAGLVMVLKLLDMGYYAALDRPFDLATDLGFVGPLKVLVRHSVGQVAGDVVLLVALLAGVALVLSVPAALVRLTGAVVRRRGRAAPVLGALTVLWLVGAVSGIRVPPGEPLAAASSVRVATAQVGTAAATVRGQHRFAARLSAPDPVRDAGPGTLLGGLRGKDVVVAVVESYGRVAVDGPRSSATVRHVLDSGTATLRASGFASRSAFLTSPTFGGHSWLAHATLESGLWVSDQGRFEQLMASDRMTLSRLFGRLGWRTVAVVPSDRGAWPDGRRFYRFDRIDNAHHLGYEGPSFGFASMPDQFALEALHRLELGRADRPPVFAQVELASSHAPWAPVPRLVPWDRLGDGSVFGPMRRDAESAVTLWRHQADVPAAYAGSIAYSLQALVSFVQTYGDDDLVLVLFGDHQPATVVSGYHASRQVPVTIVTKDRAVLGRIAGWHWEPGLRPGGEAPVWRMDAFRDRLVDAFSAQRSPTP